MRRTDTTRRPLASRDMLYPKGSIGRCMRRQISPEELNLVYRLIGKSVWQLQNVEDALQNMLAMREMGEPGTVSKADAEAILSKHRRHTLGTALRILEQSAGLSAGLLRRLASWKEERDWLIHRSVYECRHDMYTDNGRQKLFARLGQFAEQGNELQFLVSDEIYALCASKGLDVQAADDLARRQVAALKGEH